MRVERFVNMRMKSIRMIKWLSVSGLAVLLQLTACGGAVTTVTPAPSAGSAGVSEGESLPESSEAGSDFSSGDSTAPTAVPTALTQAASTPGITQEVPNDALYEAVYGDGLNMNMLVGIDEWGRTVEPIIGERPKRDVGIFYWMWEGTQRSTKIYDSSKIAAMENGIDILLRSNTPVSPANTEHWWGEPLYGYYDMEDEYVIRKHMELLSCAGIDFLVLEATNTITYPTVHHKIMRILSEMMAEGWDVPKVTFYTHTCSIDTINKLYRETYQQDLYPETWYRIDGKPLMIGFTDPVKDRTRSRSQASWLSDYDPQPLSQEIMDFFYFRTTVWVGCDPVTPDGWPWIEWVYPQPVYGNLINVSVASHSGGPFSLSLSDGLTNWGRGWSFTDRKNDPVRALKGSYFDEQWITVFKKDPEIVFVGGWNEWYIYKSPYEDKYILWDNVSMMYSRDVEMMKGGYNDAYLIQLAQKIRKYKNLPYTKHAVSKAKTIDVNADPAQWSDVKAVYRKFGSVNYGRDHEGAVSSLRYTTPLPRNSLQEVRVAHDAKNIYFYIRCDSAIAPYNGTSWMNVLIGTGTPSLKGWQGYEYILNRSVDGTVSVVERLDSSFGGTRAGSAAVTVRDNIMQIAVPRAALGLSASDNTFYFKVADSVEHPSDIMDYYVSGRCMPMGRLSYQYFG